MSELGRSAGSQGDPLAWGATPTPYEAWLRRQGTPVVKSLGITDLAEQEFGYWAQIGAEAYFVILQGMEGITGMYVARLPAGGSTRRERHLYEKVVYVLEGSGATVVQDPVGHEHTFEWHQGSLFAIPLNCPHTIYAMGEPVRYAAVITAPLVFDLFYNEKFIYETAFAFRERFDGEVDYFRRQSHAGMRWDTNLIPDVSGALSIAEEGGRSGRTLSTFEMAGNSLVGHVQAWPPGRYVTAHYHGGGAVFFILASEGYTLMWPNDIGERPFESGRSDKLVRVDWKPGSTFSPPTGWYHQHFNTGSASAIQLAVHHSSRKYPSGLHRAQARAGVAMSTREGGTMIDFADEDPAIRHMFFDALKRNGVQADRAWLDALSVR